MFYRLRRSLAVAKFKHETRDLLETPRLVQRAGPLTFVSMVGNSDVHAYILAMKSVYSQIGFGVIETIVAEDFPDTSIRLVEQHLGAVQIVRLNSIDTGACQSGGTWERLCYCIDRSQNTFVIQVDADILATDRLGEVVQNVNVNRSFTLCDGQSKRTFVEVAAAQKRPQNNHIQAVVERSFSSYPDAESRWYFRGSSGFAGFAKGVFQRQQLEEFHHRMRAIVGARWNEWGTEQIASNFVIANSADSSGLSFPSHFTYEGQDLDGVLYHFIGSYRFKHGLYARKARQVLGQLLSPVKPVRAAGTSRL